MHCKFTTRLISALAMPAMLGLAACDQTSNIGQSIIDDQIAIEVDSAFTVTGQCVALDSVPSRTLTKMLGSVNVADFGTITSDFVCEFMPTSSLPTAKVESIDGIRLLMRSYKGDCIGDTLAPAAVNVYRLNKPLTYPIYNSDPSTNFYDVNSKPLGSAVYSLGVRYNDTVAARNYREIEVKLDRKLADEFYAAWRRDSTVFMDPTRFTKEVFHGLAVVNSFGSGRVTRVIQTLLALDYTVKSKVKDTDRDTLIKQTGNYFALTPEVVSNSQLRYTPAAPIRERIAKGENLLVSPAGYEARMVFPADEIIKRFNSASTAQRMVNSLTFSLPVESVDPTGKITPPSTVLLVLAKDKRKFFADNALPDNKTSFYASYDSKTQRYYFNMRDYIVSLIDKAKEGKLDASDYTFNVVPVTIGYTKDDQNNSNVMSSMTPEITTMSAAKILFDKAKIVFTYSRQIIKI